MSQSPNAFELLRQQPIEALNLVVEEYRHPASGARHFHLASDHDENVFMVTLKTVPQDSKGAAHILEHTALCGSEKYPVRDPFFMMLRRSLNTFMNALTSADWTGYPFASKNRKDYFNLLSVYLDAVFFTRLSDLDFAQEGHRLAFQEAGNPQSPLQYKGVVYNEMKGALSSSTNYLWHTLCKYLFPNITYHFVSGGDPEHIPDLTYEELRAFHRKHYHPSNAIFFTFGNIPAAEQQQIFIENALQRYASKSLDLSIPDEKRYLAPLAVEEAYALDEQETSAKTHIVVAWLLGKNTDHRSLLHAQFVTDILLENSASPLLQALETTSLGTAPSPLCGLEDGNREMSFVCGIEGSEPEHAQAVEDLILQVLQDVAENGIAEEKLAATLHQLELHQREITGGSYPYGLQLIMRSIAPAIHGGDVVAGLDIAPILQELREAIQDPEFIKQLVKTLLLDNPHRVRLTLRPDTTLSQKRAQAEEQRLAVRKANLTKAEQEKLLQQAQALEERQNQRDDLSLLPKVSLADIPPKPSTLAGEHQQQQGYPVHYYAQGTNGLVYTDIICSLNAIPPALQTLLPYYTALIGEVGVGDKSYLATQEWQTQYTGGIMGYSKLCSQVDDKQAVLGHFTLSGKALNRNADALAELLHTTHLRLRLDEEQRIRELIAQARCHAEQGITGAGHSLAMLAASCGHSPVAAYLQETRGLAGIRALKQLDDRLADHQQFSELQQRLMQVHEYMLASPKQFLLVGESDQHASFTKAMLNHWQAQSATEFPVNVDLQYQPHRTATAWLTSTQVNFCAKAYPTVSLTHPDAPVLTVLADFLRNGFLHRAIRERGGAYGGGASHDNDNAVFRLFSYRDPRLQDTLEDFDESLHWLMTHKHESHQVEEAILGVISSLDKPSSPAAEAKQAFYREFYGRNDAIRQEFRAAVLNVTLEDLQRVANTYLQPSNASMAVITNTQNQAALTGLDVTIETL